MRALAVDYRLRFEHLEKIVNINLNPPCQNIINAYNAALSIEVGLEKNQLNPIYRDDG